MMSDLSKRSLTKGKEAGRTDTKITEESPASTHDTGFSRALLRGEEFTSRRRDPSPRLKKLRRGFLPQRTGASGQLSTDTSTQLWTDVPTHPQQTERLFAKYVRLTPKHTDNYSSPSLDTQAHTHRPLPKVIMPDTTQKPRETEIDKPLKSLLTAAGRARIDLRNIRTPEDIINALARIKDLPQNQNLESVSILDDTIPKLIRLLREQHTLKNQVQKLSDAPEQSDSNIDERIKRLQVIDGELLSGWETNKDGIPSKDERRMLRNE